MLQGAGSTPLLVKGITELSFTLGKKNYTHKFYVIKEASRNMIIGLDFLKKHNARIYLDLEKLRLNGDYIDLEQDIHIASVVRLTKDVAIAPQTRTTIEGKIKQRPYFKEGQLCEMKQDEKSWITNEPGLLLANSISILTNQTKCKMMLVNTTNKTYKLKRGSVLGTMSVVDNSDISTLAEITKQKSKELPTKPNFEEVTVPTEYKHLLMPILKENSDIFAAHDTDFGKTDTVTMKIDTKGHPPIKQRPYRTPLAQQHLVDEAINEMLEKDIIEKSNSPWASPIVLVKKKDGSTRFCVDYRKLNSVTVPLAVPLPLIDDLLGILGKSVFFTSLDLISGYWQILLDPKDREKTAFCTSHRSLYQFKVMAFGLQNAPGVFTQLISQVLEGYEEFSTSYIDDILCFSETLEAHLEHLKIIFQRLREHGLKLKLKKCTFMQPETSYLGYKLTKDGIKPDEKKIEAMKNLKPPTTKKEVRSLIGSYSYYRKFLPNFSGIAKPLIELTQKNTRFKWTEVHQKAFDYLKDSLNVIPLLSYPDVTREFTLYTDASQFCIGACLTQLNKDNEELPVYFISHKLSDTQTRWSTIEKEAFAVFYSVQKLNYILYGAKFTIKTDHQPLIYLLNAPSNNRKIQNWMLQLAAYNCTIEHIKGTDNHMADMLSRDPGSKKEKNHTESPSKKTPVQEESSDIDIDVPDQTFHVQTLNSRNFAPKEYAAYTQKNEPINLSQLTPDMNMKEEQDKDPEITKILKDMKNKQTKTSKRYITQDGVLYYLTDPDGDPVMRLVVPTHLRPQLIKAYHDENGHFGVDKCYHNLARSYFWPNMFHDLWEHITKCIKCSQRNLRKEKPPLKETEIPPYAFAKISLDIAGPFPITLSGNRYIVSFVDWLSGWIEAFPVPDKTADTVIYLLQNELFPRFGCPLVLVTDNGGENINKAMKETLTTLNIHHVKTSVFHPQSNAKVERSHRTMNDVLVKLMEDKQCKTWDVLLPQVLAAMRFNYSDTTGQSAFSLLYGRDVILPIDSLLQPRRKYYGEEAHQILLEAQHEAFVRVHRRMKKQKAKQTKYANKTAKDIKYRVGDPVFLKNHKKTCKLSPSWQPYYRIIEQTSPLTFRVKNQLTGEVTTTHVEHLILAKTEWEVKEQQQQTPRPQHRTRIRNVLSDTSIDSDPQIESEAENEEQNLNIPSEKGTNSEATQQNGNNQESDKELTKSESLDIDATDNEEMEEMESYHTMDEEPPLNENQQEALKQLSKSLKRQRERSSDEENIPLAELSKRIKMRNLRQDELNSLALYRGYMSY